MLDGFLGDRGGGFNIYPFSTREMSCSPFSTGSCSSKYDQGGDIAPTVLLDFVTPGPNGHFAGPASNQSWIRACLSWQQQQQQLEDWAKAAFHLHLR